MDGEQYVQMQFLATLSRMIGWPCARSSLYPACELVLGVVSFLDSCKIRIFSVSLFV